VYTQYTVGILHTGADVKRASECSKRPSSKAAVSEEAKRTFRYVERLSETRTLLADFFSILLELDGELEPDKCAYQDEWSIAPQAL
jgi:hypothetical protein